MRPASILVAKRLRYRSFLSFDFQLRHGVWVTGARRGSTIHQCETAEMDALKSKWVVLLSSEDLAAGEIASHIYQW